MTARETERLAIVETKMDTVQGDIREIKGDIKSILEAIETQNSTFISKKSAWSLVGLVAIIIAPIVGVVATKVMH